MFTEAHFSSEKDAKFFLTQSLCDFCEMILLYLSYDLWAFTYFNFSSIEQFHSSEVVMISLLTRNWGEIIYFKCIRSS